LNAQANSLKLAETAARAVSSGKRQSAETNMNIDERLELLTERLEALTQTVELLTRDLSDMKVLVNDVPKERPGCCMWRKFAKSESADPAPNTWHPKPGACLQMTIFFTSPGPARYFQRIL
jgi:hypothetical protein